MSFRTILFYITVTAISAGFVSDSFGQHAFPYVGKVTGTDVYVRSGPGTAYYFTGKVDEPSAVVVVGKKYGWLEIVPPAGSFSWISKKYVDPESSGSNVGVVTGDSVRVWAGSPHVEPISSSSLQTKLNKGDVVKLTGKEKGDYYMVEPPASAHLWISEDYVEFDKPFDPGEVIDSANVGGGDLISADETDDSASDVDVTEPEPIEDDSAEESVDQGQVDQEEDMITSAAEQQEQAEEVEEAEDQEPVIRSEQEKNILLLKQRIDEQVQKSLNQQDYSGIRSELEAIVNNPSSERVRRYAQFQLDRIERYQLAVKSVEIVRQQDKELKSKRAQIAAEKAKQLKQVPDDSMYSVEGTLKASHIYTASTGQKRYMVLDENGKIICYAVSGSSGAEMEAVSMLNEKVGLIGEFKADEKTPISLIVFSQVNLIED